MNYPKISIVTPSFNHGAYLESTIQSVINQNYPNLEYIIIDGGSTDNSLEIIRKYEKHLTYWVSEKDRGMYDAINKGFQKSTGDIMAWINSDDLYHRTAFHTIAKIFTSLPEINWLQGAPTTFDATGQTAVVRPIRQWSKYNFYLEDFEWIQQESTFWKRSLWDKAGSHVNTALRYAGDFELWLRFFRHEKLYISNVLLGGFRIGGANQLSIVSRKNYLEELNACLNQETLDSSIQKRISDIKSIRKLLNRTSRLNIGSLKLKYHKLFEYPSQVVFNTNTQQFELKPAEGFTY